MLKQNKKTLERYKEMLKRNKETLTQFKEI
jgi:hypothetical protein